MYDQPNEFRTALVGGFVREDVLQYVEGIAKDAKDARAQAERLLKERAELQEKANTAQQENTMLKQRNAELLERMGQLTLELDKVRSEATQKLAQQQTSDAERMETQTRLEQLLSENETMQAKITELTVYAERYQADKEHLAEIELEAHHRAKEIEARAYTHVEEIRGQARELIAAAKNSMEQISERWKENVLSVAQAAAQQEQAARELLERMDNTVRLLEHAMQPPQEHADEHTVMKHALDMMQTGKADIELPDTQQTDDILPQETIETIPEPTPESIAEPENLSQPDTESISITAAEPEFEEFDFQNPALIEQPIEVVEASAQHPLPIDIPDSYYNNEGEIL